MLAGFLAPTSGSASVCGFDVEKQPLRGQARARLPARGRAELRRNDVHDVPRIHRRQRAASRATPREKRLDDVDRAAAPRARAGADRSRRCRRASSAASASRRRSCTTREVLILDEPTDGLDPNQKHEVRALISAMAHEQDIVDLDAHPRRSRCRLHARDHHRARPHPRRRHAEGPRVASAVRPARRGVPHDHGRERRP